MTGMFLGRVTNHRLGKRGTDLCTGRTHPLLLVGSGLSLQG